MTGIATAYMDSVPLVVITGQVGRGVIGTDSFQESDIVGITMPVVKHSYLLQSTDELTRTIREAFHIAVTGRPGPVLIDIPSDVAGETMVFEYPDAVNLPSYKPTYRGNAKQIRAACRLLEEAEQPLLYVRAAASFHQRRPTRLWPSWTRCAFPPSSPSWARAACPRAIR